VSGQWRARFGWGLRPRAAQPIWRLEPGRGRVGQAARAAPIGKDAMLAAEAQQAGKIPRIAFISTTSSLESPTTTAFRQGLQDLGYVEGENIIVEWRWGGGTTERLPNFAAEVVGLNADVIVAANNTVGRAAQRLTKTVPIVIAIMSDPVGSGLVATLARPGGNITGLSSQAPDFIGRRLQLLKETIPRVARVALLVDTNDQGYRQSVRAAEVAARTLGMQLRSREVRHPSELNEAFVAIKKEAAGAVVIVGGTMFYANRGGLAEQALKSRLPMVCGPREFVDAGCLLSYVSQSGFGAPLRSWIRSSRVPSRPNSPSSNRRGSTWASISRPRRPSA
jgi:putative ABC transport system substrate-binding protein